MKVIIAGGRNITDYSLVLSAIRESGFTITEVVSGMAPGVDTLAVQYAKENDLPLQQFWAEWGFYGKSAGPIRNRNMAKYGEALIAIWDGKSRGTKNMIEEATKRNLPVYVLRTDEDRLATLEDALEFDKKRNYTYTCNCHTCYPISALDSSSVFMRLCPECGNKRCPKATNHINPCTNSNEPNQPGSKY
jgi:hypothetical protein